MRIGIDLGGTSAAVGLVDEKFNVLQQTSIKTNDCKTEKALFDNLKKCVYDLISISGISLEQIESIGIGSPGSIDIDRGIAVIADNLPLRDTPIVKIFEEEFHKKVYLDNDANCAAWGEFNAGAAKEYNNAVMITLGTGIGGGIIVDGKLLHGKDNLAGEIGHIVVDIHGKRCACGRIGCWETLASTKALTDRVRTEVEHVPYSIIGNVVSENNGVVDGRTLFTAMKRGCKVAKSIFEDYIELLGVGVLNIIEVLRPDIIVLGGGISKEGDTIVKPLVDNIGESATIIETSKLNDDAGIIGAALLYLK
jgi:glucokinase